MRRVGGLLAWCERGVLARRARDGLVRVGSVPKDVSFTQHPSTPLRVLVARATAWLMASSTPCSEDGAQFSDACDAHMVSASFLCRPENRRRLCPLPTTMMPPMEPHALVALKVPEPQRS